MKKITKTSTFAGFAGGILLILLAAVFNQPPIAEIQVSANQIYACGKVDLDGSKSFDPDGQVVSWQWNLSNEWTGKKKILGFGKKIIFGPPDTNEPGSYTITLIVTDNGKKMNSKSVNILVRENRKPQIEKIEIEEKNKIDTKKVFLVGDTLIFKGVFRTGTIDDATNFVWEYDKTIFRLSNPNSATTEVWVISAPYPYEYYTKIVLRAKDTCGQEDKKEISIAVKKLINTPPRSKMTVPEKVNENTKFRVDGSKSTTGTESNEEGDKIVSFRWWWTKYNDSKILGTGTDMKMTLKFPDSGFYDVYLEVTDRYGATNTSKETIFVQETEDDPPVADASKTKPTAILGEIIILDGSNSLDDQGIEYYIWDIVYLYGNQRYPLPKIRTDQPKYLYIFEREGLHEITLTVEDTAFPSHTSSQAFRVQVVAAPHVVTPVPPRITEPQPIIYITPEAPSEIPQETPRIPNANPVMAIAVLFVAYWIKRRIKR